MDTNIRPHPSRDGTQSTLSSKCWVEQCQLEGACIPSLSLHLTLTMTMTTPDPALVWRRRASLMSTYSILNQDLPSTSKTTGSDPCKRLVCTRSGVQKSALRAWSPKQLDTSLVVSSRSRQAWLDARQNLDLAWSCQLRQYRNPGIDMRHAH